MIRILVVDDHPSYREGVRALLGAFDDVDVVGEAADGNHVVDVVDASRPDAVLLDLGLPGRSGLALLPELRNRWPTLAIVVVTMDDDDESIRIALRRGARGYLLKDAGAAEIHRALHAAVSGGVTLSATLAERVPALIDPGPRVDHSATGRLRLAPSEEQVLHHLATGSTNQQIADALHIAPKTVRNRLSSIYAKLGVVDRSQAALRARELGFGAPSGTT